MELLAADSKEFKRTTVTRTLDNSGVVKDPKAFYTQLGVAVVISDPERFREAFIAAFREVAEKHRVTLLRLFGSSSYVVDSLCARRYMQGRAFLYAVLDRIQHLIRHIDVTWLIASPVTVPTVTVGGKGSALRELPLKDFFANAGNVYPMISGWVYTKVFPEERPNMELDHFQCKPSVAWDQLSSSGRSLQIFPWGDECNPFICTADILAYLTDRGLHAAHTLTGRGRLSPEDVRTLWADRPFEVRAGYLDPQVFPDIAPINDSAVRLHKWYPAGMTYLLVDPGLLNDPPIRPPDASALSPVTEAVSYRDLLVDSRIVNAAYLSAQLDRSAFKFFDAPTDTAGIHDGDRLVYMGKISKTRVETIASGVEVKAESMLELRQRLRAQGHSC